MNQYYTTKDDKGDIMAKQIFVVIEGTDGCGKKTQSEKLLARLQNSGLEVIRQSFPNYDSQSSGPVKMYLNGDFGDSKCFSPMQASALYAVDRLCTMKLLEPYIKEGGSIVFDRYVSSNMLHQTANIKDDVERDKMLEEIDYFEHEVLGLPRPHMVFFLDMPVEYSQKLANARAELKSGNARDILEADTEHLSNAYHSGKFAAKKYGWEVVSCIDGDGNIRSIEDINDEIYARCKRVLDI